MGGVTLQYTSEQVLILPASWVLPGEWWQGSGFSQALVRPSADPVGHCGRYQDLSSQTGQLPSQAELGLLGPHTRCVASRAASEAPFCNQKCAQKCLEDGSCWKRW